jgi:hypothetical protein
MRASAAVCSDFTIPLLKFGYCRDTKPAIIGTRHAIILFCAIQIVFDAVGIVTPDTCTTLPTSGICLDWTNPISYGILLLPMVALDEKRRSCL